MTSHVFADTRKTANKSRILRAEHMGMCFGVRDAIHLALDQAQAGPITILGDLVHNATVTAELSDKGVCATRDLSAVRTKTVMITAHGASDRMIAAIRDRGLNVVEATCPLVLFAHRAVKSLVRDGYHPVIIGQPGHVEVLGLTGDLDAFDIVMEDADVLTMAEHPKIGIAAQTTQPIDKVERFAGLIRRRFPHSDVRFMDTVCQPTKQRQSAARELAERCDVVIVIGGASSNNTRELVSTSRRECSRVHHVQTDSDLCGEWFRPGDVIGVTAGTSTPDSTIDGVEARIRELTQ